MMEEENESDLFFKAASNGKYNYKKHNETDFERFNKFQNEIDKRYSELEKKRILRERIQSLKKWDESLPERWRGASLSTIENPAAKESTEIINNLGKGSFFMTGDAGSGKTYISYAIVRKYIGKGWTSRSQVKILSEESMLNLAYTGFEGKSKFEKLFDSRYNVYIFDNVGERDEYNVVKEVPLWERMIDHIYNNSLSAIFTSINSPIVFSNLMSDSAQAKFSHLISERIVNVKGSRTPVLNDNNILSNKNNKNDTDDPFSAFGK